LLAEVHTVCINGLRNIDAIIDDERDRSVSANLSDSLRLDENVLDAAVLLAELDGIGPAPNGEPSKFGVGAFLLEVEIGEDVQATDIPLGNGRFSVCGRLLHGVGASSVETVRRLHI
jgi:hypothetical protein